MQKFLSTLAVTLSTTLLAACAHAPHSIPTSAQIESVGMLAMQTHQPAEIATLTQWAMDGFPVAQRELALVYAGWPLHDREATQWLQKAATNGDSDAQTHLADAFYKGTSGFVVNHALAWTWYEKAAMANNARASFMLARMAKYGDGIQPDQALSVHWLMTSSRQGNGQAMFLLSNAYSSGEGVTKDARLAREWLEKSAAADFPVAVQALAMLLESVGGTVDVRSPENAKRAHDLLREANEDRLLYWDSYQ